jgi:carboxyl-terminal processing protease
MFMKRRHFLKQSGLALAASVLPHTRGSSQHSRSSGRFLEVVRIINAQWYDERRSEIVRMAMEAAGARPGRGYNRPLDAQAVANLTLALDFEGQGNDDWAIKRLVSRMDPWSSYLTPTEWRQYNESLKPSYSGVGMDLEREKDGSFTCWPYPGSAAAVAGVQPGAKLLSVDGCPVESLSLYAIGAMVRGKRGSPVSLGVSRFLGLSGSINILRTPAHSQTVFQTFKDGTQVLRISRFSSGTPGELSALIDSSTPFVELNLTGCRGGDLDAAVEAASLFLPEGALVASIDRVGSQEVLRASGGRKLLTQLTLHQDGNSASAAEVFIASLVENRRASSYGSTSLGKATTQDVITLRNGGALVLTTGLIHGPSRRSWQSVGLKSSR